MQIEIYNPADIGVFMRNFMLNNYNLIAKTQLLQYFCLILLPKRNITQNHRVRSYGLQGNFRAEAKERPANEKANDG